MRRVRAILDQQQPMAVTPSSPVPKILREAEIVDQEQCARPRTEKRFKLVRVRLEPLARIVEPSLEPRSKQGLDLCAAVIGRRQHLVAGPQRALADAVPERVTGTGEQDEVRCAEWEQ